MIDKNDLVERILDKGVLEVAVKDIQSMSHDEYALKRKDFFGASDSSILCDVNLYKNLTQLIDEKNKKYITDEEKEVGEKPIVKKGFDLEPIILNKAEEELLNLGRTGFLFKPDDMFKFKEVDGLSVNYDGVWVEGKELIPVEAKLVSKYGEKYYNKNVTHTEARAVEMKIAASGLDSHIKRMAMKFGIPAYYYTQVQQEIAGLDAPYGYLAAQFDDSWTFKLFLIPRDQYVIDRIYDICETKIKEVKRTTD